MIDYDFDERLICWLDDIQPLFKVIEMQIKVFNLLVIAKSF